MARSAITVVEPNHAWADAAPDAIDKSNHHSIADGENFKRMVIFVDISAGTGTGGAVTLKAGTTHPAFRKDLGDLATSGNLTANDQKAIGPVETARYIQSDGTIHLDITDTSNTDIAGEIHAIALP